MNALMKEFMDLCRMSDIPNMELYAQRFYVLARRFEYHGFEAMAASCHARWEQYKPMTGHYIRVGKAPLVELVEVV